MNMAKHRAILRRVARSHVPRTVPFGGLSALAAVFVLSCAPAEPAGSHVETVEPLVLTPAGFIPADAPGFLHQRVEEDRVVMRFQGASPIIEGMVIASLTAGAIYVRHVLRVEHPGDGTVVAHTETADVTEAFRSGHVILHIQPMDDLEDGEARAALVDLFATAGPLECRGDHPIMLRRYFEPRVSADADIQITPASVATGALACAASQFVPLRALGANCLGVIERFSMHVDASLSSGVAISHMGAGECEVDALATSLPELRISVPSGVPIVIGVQPTISVGFATTFEERMNARVGATLSVVGDVIYERRTGWRQTFRTPSFTSDISGLELDDTLEVTARWQAGVRVGAYVGGIAGPFVDLTGQLDWTRIIRNGWGPCGTRLVGSASVEVGGELRCPPSIGASLCPASARIGVVTDPVPLWSGLLHEEPFMCSDEMQTATCGCDDLDGDGQYPSLCGDASCPMRTDCNDLDASIHAGAVDGCDFVDNDCDGDTDPGCGVLVRRYIDCTSHHWSSTLESLGPYCAPAPSEPAAGCALAECGLTTCGGSSCWAAEYGPGKSFHTYARQEGGLTSLRRLYHCYLPDTLQNVYQLAPCTGGLVTGVPAEMGLIAPAPTGFMTSRLYTCQWMPGRGEVDHFLTTNLDECSGVDGVHTELGFVMP